MTKKKAPVIIQRLFNLTSLAVPIVTGRYQPSIVGVMGLTSVFGMGTGVAPSLSPPGNF